MTDAEIFHRETTALGLGGRLAVPLGNPAEKYYGNIAERAKLLISKAREFLPHLPPIHFDFVFNGDINAIAFKSDGRYFIGLNTGTIYMLELVFMRMLADSRLFPSIGNRSEEANDLPPLTGYVPQAQQMYEAGVIPSPPKTKPRLSYAIHLFNHALHFLVGHEIAHITLGHVDYLQSKTGTALIAEMNWNQTDAEGLIERQSLEAQADTRSVFSSIASIKLAYATPNREVPPWASSPLTVERMIFDWAFAMNSLFRLFGDSRFNSSELATTAYPPLPMRRAIATAMACLSVIWWDQGLKDKASKALNMAMHYTEGAFSMILGIDPSTEGLADAYSPSGREHYKRLMACWKGELRKRLAEFRYEDLFSGEPASDQPIDLNAAV
jgi:hypothetical protein